MLTIGELFAGYGGLGMGVKAALGGEVRWVSDIDKGACKILAHRFPDVPNLSDITAVDWATVEPVDILTGGFPCQDVSHAGRRAGLIRGETRTGLWAEMLRGIATMRPRLVVAENVRGLLSARADSDVEPCPWCLGDADDEPPMRALGAVLADLADIGYDAAWCGLRAADVGAAHGRFRVFILAWPADTSSHAGRVEHGDGLAAADAGRVRGHEAVEHNGRRATEGDWRGVPDKRDRDALRAGPDGEVTLLGTPQARDYKGVPGDGFNTGSLPRDVALLPTPAVNDMGAGKTVEWWDEWAPRQKSADGRPAPHGKSLAIEAQRLLPTPRASDGPDASSHSRSWSTTDNNLHTVVKRGEIRNADSAEVRPGEELSDLRDSAGSQEVRERSTRGPGGLPAEEVLLDPVLQHEGGRPSGQSSMEGAAGQEAGGVRDLRSDEEAARSPHRPGCDEQPPVEPDRSVRVVSPETALARGSRRSDGLDFGPYSAAIERWEAVLGRPAPAPTQLSAKGNPQLSPEFTTWLMGLPDGWITDIPGITRNEALKACGNGVVPQQCAAAVRWLWQYVPASVRAELLAVAA